jgi:molybdopterin/thiamine biosynthesis adenylyltransferase
MNTLIHEEKFRGQNLLRKMAEQEFIICGVGAIGSNLVETMVRQGFKKFTIIDMDRVDDHNRHTQIYGRRDIGQLKVSVVKARIYDLMGVNIEAVSKKLEASNVKKLLTAGSIVIDGFDNSESRRLVADHCRANKILCLHAGLYKDCAEVHWNAGYRVPDPVKGLDVCEYPLARNIILMAITVATEVIIRYLDKGMMENYYITLGDMKINFIV